MTSMCGKRISAEVRLIHAEQIPLHHFIVLRKKKQQTQLKNKQVKQNILNQWESWVFGNLLYLYIDIVRKYN